MNFGTALKKSGTEPATKSHSFWSTHGRILQPGSNALKPHIQQLYGTPQTCIQVVAMRKLADIFQWGDPTLLKELSEGFQLLGNLSPGWGWPKRTNERYSQPITKEQLLTDNLYYTQQKPV